MKAKVYLDEEPEKQVHSNKSRFEELGHFLFWMNNCDVKTKLSAFLKLNDEEVIDYILASFNKLQDEKNFVARLIDLGIQESKCKFVYKILDANKQANGQVVVYNTIDDILATTSLPKDSLQTVARFIENIFTKHSSKVEFVNNLKELDLDTTISEQLFHFLTAKTYKKSKLVSNNTNDVVVIASNDLEPVVNKVYKCIITGKTTYGIFCRVLGVSHEPEAMCHKSELPWKTYIEQFNINDSVFAKVLRMQPNGKIAVSMRNVDQMTGKPLQDIQRGRTDQRSPSVSAVEEKKLTSPERWEISKLISSGAAKLDDYPEYKKFIQKDNQKASTQASLVNEGLPGFKHQLGKKRNQLNELAPGEDIEIEFNKNSTPAFIKKNETLKTSVRKYQLEPLTKIPKGSMNRNASSGSALVTNFRNEKADKKKELAQQKKSDHSQRKEPLKLTGSNNIDIGQINALTAWERKKMREKIEYGKRTNLSLKEQRESLPVYKMRQDLLDAINGNQFMVIVGETGSGKTTQLTQYLYEEGYNANGLMIGCTQPRRVAAISVAKRVSEEMECALGGKVGYTVRFDDQTSRDTKIKYMTDGILQREALLDPLMSKYSVIILDEAHERTVATDVLFCLLKKAALQRPDLKVIVTSATLDSKKFSEYFTNCPVLKIPGKTFPVDVFYSKALQMDYVEAALDTVMEIHINEARGDILVFLTGQEEIDACCEILFERVKNLEDTLDLKLIILPVYSALPNEIQSKIFEPTPPDSRKVIFATNIAETSITIDGIHYVVDPGFSKVNTYNPRLGIEQLIITPISQAQSNQRKGRAGRTGPGKCYRLYTESAFLNEMLPSTVPDIKRQNLSNTILLLKAMGISDLLSFEFMDPPPKSAMVYALEELYHLQALDDAGQLTPLGKKMSQFPMEPLLSRTLLASIELKCSEEVLIIISLLSVQNIFYRPKNNQIEADRKRMNFAHPYGDHLTLLNVYNKWKVVSSTSSFSRNKVSTTKWCEMNYLHERHLKKSKDVYDQIRKIFDKLDLQTISCGPNIDNVRKAFVFGFFRNSAKKKSGNTYTTIVDNTEATIHPGSVLFGKSCDYVIYHSLIMTTTEYMSTLTTIDPKWLCECAPHFFKAHVMNNKKMKIESLDNRNGDKNEWRLSSLRRKKESLLSNSKK